MLPDQKIPHSETKALATLRSYTSLGYLRTFEIILSVQMIISFSYGTQVPAS